MPRETMRSARASNSSWEPSAQTIALGFAFAAIDSTQSMTVAGVPAGGSVRNR